MKKLLTGASESEQMFFRNEFGAMYSGSLRKRLTLPLFVFLALLGVTFSTSGLRYLEDKMRDPYVKWIEFPVTYKMERGNAYETIKDTLSSWSSRNEKYLFDFTGYYRGSMEFFGENGLSPYVVGRTIDPFSDKPLLERILEPDMVVIDHRQTLLQRYDGNEEYMWRRGLVLTEEVYRKLFPETSPPQVVAKYGYTLCPSYDVIAVVKRLPGKSGFLCTHSMYWSVRADNDVSDLRSEAHTDTLSILVSLAAARMALSDLDIARLEAVNGVVSVKAQPLSDDALASHDTRLSVKLNGRYDLETRKNTFREIELGLRGLNPAYVERLNFKNHHNVMEVQAIGSAENMYNQFTLGFDRLDSIRVFSNAMYNVLEVELDLNRVESLENYRLVSVLTKTLGTLLLFFALISVIIFIFNLVSSHLENIKGNLGTFRAFGLTKAFLFKAYLRIVFSVLTLSVIGSLAVMAIISYSGLASFMLSLLKYDDDLVQTKLEVFNPWVVFLILALYTSGYLVTRSSVMRILNHAPGDLIYGRS